MQRKINRNKRKFSQLRTYLRSRGSSNVSELFVDAECYPDFFKDNLVDNDRKIKVFMKHPHAHQTIFYFQLLKLIFETDCDYEKYLLKFYDILDNPEFQFIVPQYDDPYYLPLSDSKLKKLLGEFLQEMGQGQMGIQEALSKYPIMDKILVLFLRTLLIIAEKCEDFNDEVLSYHIYEFLANYFQIQISYYQNCIRFDQVDVFAYLEGTNQVYLAYISPEISEQEIVSTSQFYQNDPEEDFNISSVKQMISEIDIPQEDCFNMSKCNQSQQTESIDYNYSHSEDLRRVSKSIQDSDIKLSYLINEDSLLLQNYSAIRSNRILEKEIISDKRNATSNIRYFAKPIKCYDIEEAPPQLENAISPASTPKGGKFMSFGKEEAKQFQKQNIYKGKKDIPSLKDSIKQENDMIQTSETAFEADQKNNWQNLKQQTLQLLYPTTSQIPSNKGVTLKSLYEMKSIKSISCADSESYVLNDSPFHSPIQRLTMNKAAIVKPNEYTKYGVINNNISNQFTSSFLIKQMKEPFQSNISSIKTRARKQRGNIQKMIYL